MTCLTIRCLGLSLFAVLLTGSVTLRAQELPLGDAVAAAPPAHIAFIEGTAVLERDGHADPAPIDMPLLAGDRMRTQDGRVEILFGDGSVLHLDANTTVDFQSDELIRLLDGRLRLTIPGPARPLTYRIDAPSAEAYITQPGEYRVAILHGDRADEVELAVVRGAAELVNGNGRTPLRAGERAFSRADAAPSYAYVFNSAAWDAFDRWSEARRDQRLAVSTQYLPNEVRPYAASFDRYGDWCYETSYGYVWYPTVSAGWRPYYNGRWATLRSYGWTWIDADPWGWPTHHYGRWGVSAGAWFWIPGRNWGPAWVSWAYAPDYIGWCPLGWNNRPVVQIAGVTVQGGADPWRAWTVAPRRHFGNGSVNVRAVAVGMIDNRTRAAFVARSAGPDLQGHAVPRSGVPIHAAGANGAGGHVAGRDSPSAAGAGRERSTRGSLSPVYTNLQPGASRVATAAPRTLVGPPPAASSAQPQRTRVDAVASPMSPRTTPAPGQSDRPSAGAPNRAAPADNRIIDRPPPGADFYGRPDRSPSGGAVRPYGGAPGAAAERALPIASFGTTRSTPRTDAAPPAYRSDTGGRGSNDGGRGPGDVRAAPPRAPESPPPPQGYRASPGVERRAPEPSRPSGPPPGVEPRAPESSRPSGPPPEAGVRSAPAGRPAEAPAARPRSEGQPSSGTAVPRRGRG